MKRVICRELRKVQVDSETAYGSAENVMMVGQYLRGTLQVLRVMDDFLISQFQQHPEVVPHINLYFFEHWDLRVEVVALKQRLDFQAKTIRQTEKTCKELRSRMDSLTNKAKLLSKK